MSDYMEDILSEAWLEYGQDSETLVSECELTDDDYLDETIYE